ncbi:hypothetical protein H2200_007652 [Cladophialophora chaetospira]|uniref:Uncharacterized protein n=1 Tax=Cladophialophora chaetospira TaxID=386627 RepID=A0AA39CGM0_9EURO|nr:hypothetical protein H2200_007652 [Cladophialophora chaetospira]
MVKSKSAEWPPGSQRALLDWVDVHKGPNGELVKDNKEAIRELRDYLVDSLDSSGEKRYHFGTSKNALPMTEIRRKLDSLWSNRLSKFKSSGIEVFYTEGSLALDWNKLGHEPLAADYTAEEIASKRRLDVEGNNTSEERSSTDKGAHSVQIQSVTAGHSSSARNTLAVSGDNGQLGRSVAKPKEPGELNIQDPTNSADRPEIPLVQENQGQQDPAGGARPQKSPDRNECRSMPPWVIPNRSTLGNPLPIEPSKSPEPGAPPYYLNAMRMLADRPLTENRDMIHLALDGISSSIGDIVATFMIETGIPTTQPMIFDSDIRWPPECSFLLGQVLGQVGYHGTDLRAEVLSDFHRTKVPLNDFIRSFIACAITFWCLESGRTDEEKYYNSLSDGSLKRTFETAFEPMLYAEMRQRLWREYLNTSVKPKIESESHSMASLLQAYVELLVPTDAAPKGFFVDRHVVSVPSKGPGKSDTDAEPDSARFKLKESKQSVNLRLSLARLIQHALMWRVELSIGIDEKYHFVWPSFMDEYDRDDYGNRSSMSPVPSEAEDSGETRVLLGLMPVAWRSTRKVVSEENWTNWVTVCKGKVIRL